MPDLNENLQALSTRMLGRRSFIKLTAAFGATVGTGSLLAACGDDGGNEEDTNTPASSGTTATTGGGGSDATATTGTGGTDGSPIATSTAILSGASTTTGGDEGPIEGGTLRVGIGTNLETPDPHKARTGAQTTYAKFLSDALVRFDAFGELQPLLATAWEVTEDGLTYDFTLVEGATFHDGESFDAEAAKFNFDRLLDTEFGAFLREPLPKVTSVEAVNATTLRFVLSVNSALFVPNLTWGNLCMVSPAAVESAGEAFSDNPVGLGLFKFVSYTPDQDVQLERFDDYWGGAANLEGVKMRVIPEDATRLLEFENGDLDLSILVPKAEVERLSEDFVLVEGARFGFAWLAMNLQMPLFQDIRMRQAFARAVDTQIIIDEVYYGLADQGIAGIPPATWGVDPNIEALSYDPDAAAALLDEMGWTLGDGGIRQKDGQALKVKLRGYTQSEHVLQTQILQELLRAVGIDSEIETSEAGAFFEAMRGEQYEVGIWSLGGIGDAHPGEFSGSLRTDYYWNPSRHNIAELDAVIDALQSAHDQDEAKELASEYQRLMIEHQPVVWLWHTGQSYALQQNVQGVEISSDNLIHLQGAWLSE